MAKNFLTPLGLVSLPSDPATGSEGQLYFNTTSDIVRVYKNGVWENLTPTTEEIQDAVAPLLFHDNHTNLSVEYNDENNQLILTAASASLSASAGYYGSFYDTTTQSATVANTAYTVEINTTVEQNGVQIENNINGRPTRVKFLNTGVYNIQFSAQLYKPTSNAADVYVWIALNGTNVPHSAGTTGLTGNNSKIVVAWNYVMTMNANDFLEFKWSSSDNGVQMLTNTSAAPSPQIPSIIVTAQQVAAVLPGNGSGSSNYLNDLLDVSIINPENHQLVAFNQETGLWKNLHPSEINLATIVNLNNAIVTASAAAVSSASANTVSQINALTTSDIEEGSNLYFTNQRSLNTASTALVHNNHVNLTAVYNSASNQIILSASGGGSEIFYQSASPSTPEVGTLWVDEDGSLEDEIAGISHNHDLTYLTINNASSTYATIVDLNNIDLTSTINTASAAAYASASAYTNQEVLQYWSEDNTGNLLPNTDNELSIGSSELRVQHLYLGASSLYLQSPNSASTNIAMRLDSNNDLTINNSKLITVDNANDNLNLDLSNYITASAASATYQKLIPFGSASPVPTNAGEMWVDTNDGARTLKIWDGIEWFEEGYVPIPTVTSISPSSYNGLTGTLFEVFGTNFQTGATVAFIGSNGTAYSASIVTRNSSTKLTVGSINLTTANEPYSIRVTNPSGNYGLLANALDAGSTPTWNTSAGNLGTMYDIERGVKTYTVSATDPDGTSLIYSVTSGSLPGGMTLNSSTGVISGTATAVVSDTTYTFTIQATDGVNTSSREFNIIVKAPVTLTYYSNSTFTAPAQLTGVSLLAVGGGGGAGNNRGNGPGGNGGGGGIVFYNFKAVTAGQSYSIVIGGGGAGAGCNNQSGCQGGSTTGVGVTAGAGGGGVSEYNGNCSGGTSSVGVGADVIYDGGTGGCSFGAAGGGFQYTNTSFGSPTIFGGQCASGYYGGGGCASGGGGAAGIFRIKY